MPWVTRKAWAQRKLCEEMPIFIKAGELLVGDPNGAPDEVRWYPENYIEWMPEAVTTGGFSELLTEEEKRELIDDIYEYWKDRCMDARIKHVLPDYTIPYLTLDRSDPGCVLDGWAQSRHACFFDHVPLMAEGLEARLKRVEAKLEELDKRAGEMHPEDFIRKKYNWEAMLISGKAIIRYAQRHAELAREQAKTETDEARKRELEQMAEILEHVPAKPPRTFHECLQFYWIVEVVATYMDAVGNGSGIRVDQVWWPYYEADAEGRSYFTHSSCSLLLGRYIRDVSLSDGCLGRQTSHDPG